MFESSDSEFKKYLEEHEGQPIDPKIAEAGQKDLRTAEKGDYTINKISENNPKDRRGTDIFENETGISDLENQMNESLLAKIKDLEEAKDLMSDFILRGPMRNTERQEEFNIENLGVLKEEEGFENMSKAFDIFEKYNFSDQISIAEIIHKIDEEIKMTKNLIEKSKQ